MSMTGKGLTAEEADKVVEWA